MIELRLERQAAWAFFLYDFLTSLIRNFRILNKLAEAGKCQVRWWRSWFIICYKTGWTAAEIEDITCGKMNKLPGFMKAGKLTDKGIKSLTTVG